MPYISTRRNNNVFARKISRFMMYRRAKRLFAEINRDMSAVEERMMRRRLIHY